MSYKKFLRTEGKGIPNTVFCIQWELAEGDTAQPLFIPYSPDKSVQVFGTWGGATVDFMGTNDPRVITNLGSQAEDILKDTDKTDVSFAASDEGAIKQVVENVLAVYPKITGGDGTTSLTVSIVSRGGQ